MAYQMSLWDARANHDPERYEGRSWEELDLFEQESATLASEENVLVGPEIFGASDNRILSSTSQ